MFKLPDTSTITSQTAVWYARLETEWDPDTLFEHQGLHDWLHWFLGASPAQEGIVFAAEECIEYGVLSPIPVFAAACREHAFPEDRFTSVDACSAWWRLRCLWNAHGATTATD